MNDSDDDDFDSFPFEASEGSSADRGVKKYSVALVPGNNLLKYSLGLLHVLGSTKPYEMNPVSIPDDLPSATPTLVHSGPALRSKSGTTPGIIAMINMWTTTFRRTLDSTDILVLDPGVGGMVSVLCTQMRGSNNITLAVGCDNKCEEGCDCHVLRKYAKGEMARKQYASLSSLRVVTDTQALDNRKYDLIVVPHTIHRWGENHVRTLFKASLNPNGAIMGVYGNALVARDMEGTLGFNLVQTDNSSNPPTVTVEIKGKTYCDPVFDPPKLGLTMDFPLRPFLARKPWSGWIPPALKESARSPLVRYFRGYMAVKTGYEPDIPVVIPNDKVIYLAHPTYTQAHHRRQLDMAIALTKSELYRFVPTEKWYYSNKLDGSPVTVMFSGKTAEYYDHEKKQIYRAEWDGELKPGLTVIAQYEKMRSKTILRHVNSVSVGGTVMPVRFDHRQPEAFFRKNWKPLSLFPEDLVNGKFPLQEDCDVGIVISPGGSIDVQFAHSHPSHEDVVPVGCSRYVKAQPSVERKVGEILYSINLVTREAVVRTTGKNGNDMVRREAIAECVTSNELAQVARANGRLIPAQTEKHFDDILLNLAYCREKNNVHQRFGVDEITPEQASIANQDAIVESLKKDIGRALSMVNDADSDDEKDVPIVSYSHTSLKVGERVSHGHYCEDCSEIYYHEHRIKELTEDQNREIYGNLCGGKICKYAEAVPPPYS